MSSMIYGQIAGAGGNANRVPALQEVTQCEALAMSLVNGRPRH